MTVQSVVGLASKVAAMAPKKGRFKKTKAGKNSSKTISKEDLQFIGKYQKYKLLHFSPHGDTPVK